MTIKHRFHDVALHIYEYLVNHAIDNKSLFSLKNYAELCGYSSENIDDEFVVVMDYLFYCVNDKGNYIIKDVKVISNTLLEVTLNEH